MNILKSCPKCGDTLVERTNHATGESFLGCSRYPECKHTEPIPESVVLRRQGQQGMFEEEAK